MKTKSYTFLLFVVLLTFAVNGCELLGLGSANTTSAGPKTLGLACHNQTANLELCNTLAKRFTQETGIGVIVKAVPDNSSLNLALLQELSLTRSSDVDVFLVDVIWPGIFANDLLDLTPHFSQEELADFFPRIIENNTVAGKLVAIPARTDAGVLYYRRDLLQKYGFAAAPKTWDELESMAKTIQDGERAAGNANFWGYLFQGAQNEGLTCVALEVMASNGAGTIINTDGTISLNNPNTVAALERTQSWIGTIAPDDTPKFGAEDTRKLWQAGNAAFMRNWPYAYARSNNDEDSTIKGLFDVTTLPQGSGSAAATLGGWQYAISKYSDMPDEAVQLVRFMTSAEAQKLAALNNSFNPTRRSIYQDSEVLAANPFFARMPDILNAAVARPSTVTGAKYTQVTTAFYTGVHEVLTGQATAQSTLSSVEQTLGDIKGESW